MIDAHLNEVRRRMRGDRRLWMTPLHRAEWTHAIVQHVFRGMIPVLQAEGFYAAFEADRQRGLWLEAEVPEMAFETCAQLARQYGPRLGVGTLDTLHVASALELKASEFWTFDQRQGKLARAVGLKTS